MLAIIRHFRTSSGRLCGSEETFWDQVAAKAAEMPRATPRQSEQGCHLIWHEGPSMCISAWDVIGVFANE